MFFVSVLRNALLVLAPLSLILSSYVYLYPVFNSSCAFPAPEQSARTAYLDTLRRHTPLPKRGDRSIAPFRLLSLGDPQLEGDSSIPDPDAANFPHLTRFWKNALQLEGSTEQSPLQRLRHGLHDLIDFYLDDIPKTIQIYRKLLDHIGNDYYLGHIYRTLHWWTDPTHVTVLGDLVGSQWIDDDEFESRGRRFWNRVFRGGIMVSEEVATEPTQDYNKTMILGEDAVAWKQRIINVAGNHDVGYAGDLSQSRLERFTRVFGDPNYELRFHLPIDTKAPVLGTEEGTKVHQEEREVPELRIVVLNDMNLDTPAGSKELQDETYRFLNDVITTSKDVARPAHFTLILTHIPMYKDAGICIDGPFFDFFRNKFENGVKEQNHLSRDASKGLLEGVFGMSGNPTVDGQGFGRNGLILTGHDHEGCDIYHFINQSITDDQKWEAKQWEDAVISNITEEPGIPGLREITVRSMMGDFSGNAGFLSLWFDEDTWDWKFEFANCRFGKQHLWWIVHILDLVTLGVGVVYIALASVQKLIDNQQIQVSPKGKRMLRPAQSVQASSGESENNLGPEIAAYLKANGNLDTPGGAKKSLRKKRSKLNVKGGTPNGSNFSSSSS